MLVGGIRAFETAEELVEAGPPTISRCAGPWFESRTWSAAGERETGDRPTASRTTPVAGLRPKAGACAAFILGNAQVRTKKRGTRLCALEAPLCARAAQSGPASLIRPAHYPRKEHIVAKFLVIGPLRCRTDPGIGRADRCSDQGRPHRRRLLDPQRLCARAGQALLLLECQGRCGDPPGPGGHGARSAVRRGPYALDLVVDFGGLSVA